MIANCLISSQVLLLIPLKSYSQTSINTGTKGAIESVRNKRVEFRGNVRASFPQGQSKLSEIS